MRNDNTAAKRDLIDGLLERPYSIDELVARAGVSPRSIYRWLAGLSSVGYELVRLRQGGGPWRYKITARPRAPQ